MFFLLASSLLLCGSALLLLTAGLNELAQRRMMARRMGAGRGQDNVFALDRLGALALGTGRWNLDLEVPRLLDQMGWRRPGQRALFLALQAGLPLWIVLLVSGYYAMHPGEPVNWFMVLLPVSLALLVPKRLLAIAVRKRQRRMVAEVGTMIPLLRMFFEVGMTVEQALRVLVAQGSRILPELTRELRLVLARVDAGLELGEELRSMAQASEVDELKDCVAILEQLIRQGGGALASLRSLKVLLDERRMLALQETVSKLSAKMSGVMVAFLFPALLIVLAGPGFAAVFHALGGVGG